MDKIVVIDGNNNAHKAYHSYRNLTHKGKSVSILYGFISMLRAVINLHRPNKVIICWDHRRHFGRKETFPEYKAHRKKDEPNANFDYEDFIRQLTILSKVIKILGIPQLYGDGMEADDYIHWVVRKYRKSNIIVIVSSDKDFNQELVHKNVRIWNNKKRVLIHKKNIRKYFPYEATETIDFLILDGDKSDNIPGVKGFGEKTIRKFLDEFGSISSFLENPYSKFGKLDKENLLEIYMRNSILINLELFYQKYIKQYNNLVFYQDLKHPKYQPKKFKEFCIHYRFISFLDTTFIKPFNKLHYGN